MTLPWEVIWLIDYLGRDYHPVSTMTMWNAPIVAVCGSSSWNLRQEVTRDMKFSFESDRENIIEKLTIWKKLDVRKSVIKQVLHLTIIFISLLT